MDLWEINVAFAAMCVGTTRILGIDDSIVNVGGSGCGTGVAAMCAGGGMSTAGVLDVPAP